MNIQEELNIYKAIRNLVGEEPMFGFDGTTINNWSHPDGVEPPTDSEIQTEIARIKAEYDAQEYARNRKSEYPDIGDQLDDLFKAGAFSTEMTATIQAVKDKYPKE